MDAFEITKYAGAVLATALLFLVIGMVADALFEVEGAGETAHAPAPAATSEKAPPPAPRVTADAPDLATRLATADIEAGAKLFRKCAACHTLDEGGAKKIGPNLWDIVGKSKAAGDFKYSSALADLGGEWDYDSLDAFLTKPKSFAPGTKMAFAGLKKADNRSDLIGFLRLRSASPKPLP
ncbi:MAG: c-type cytochrome [Alphaproteobacteria bacterium]